MFAHLFPRVCCPYSIVRSSFVFQGPCTISGLRYSLYLQDTVFKKSTSLQNLTFRTMKGITDFYTISLQKRKWLELRIYHTFRNTASDCGPLIWRQYVAIAEFQVRELASKAAHPPIQILLSSYWTCNENMLGRFTTNLLPVGAMAGEVLQYHWLALAGQNVAARQPHKAQHI